MRSTLFWTLFAALMLSGCEEQMAQDLPEAPEEAVAADGDEVDTDALRAPGTTGYFNALKSSRDSAERLKGKVDDYNRQVEEQADDVFND